MSDCGFEKSRGQNHLNAFHSVDPQGLGYKMKRCLHVSSLETTWENPTIPISFGPTMFIHSSSCKPCHCRALVLDRGMSFSGRRGNCPCPHVIHIFVLLDSWVQLYIGTRVSHLNYLRLVQLGQSCLICQLPQGQFHRIIPMTQSSHAKSKLKFKSNIVHTLKEIFPTQNIGVTWGRNEPNFTVCD